MYTPILIGIGAVLLINIILLFCLLLRKPADPSASLREELRGIRQDTQAGQAEMRRELNTQLTGIHQMSLQTVSKLSENTLQNLESMRITLDRRLEGMRRENQTAMEQLRRSVDEQLSTTLTTGLNNSFKSVSLQLEQVSRNINEVQNMAPDIQKLHNILANVKNRGTWGEVQLGSIISDLFAPAQYESQFAITNNAERVDYAIRLPGQQHEVYLPIDAKFPMDRYTAYLSAESQGNPVLTDTAKAALLRAVKDQAKDIARKYISPPYTTDFAILFVPSEDCMHCWHLRNLPIRCSRNIRYCWPALSIWPLCSIACKWVSRHWLYSSALPTSCTHCRQSTPLFLTLQKIWKLPKRVCGPPPTTWTKHLPACAAFSKNCVVSKRFRTRMRRRHWEISSRICPICPKPFD